MKKKFYRFERKFKNRKLKKMENLMEGMVEKKVNLILRREISAMARWASELTRRVLKLEKEVRRMRKNFYK
ncbi:MAG: hypothetical protein RMJ18_02420 [Candidatus Aenigmarchaeota archaeon]|nr:hypothetical protein [Candidatus Aenigmarchaeota archaeon]MCX8190957.1 hypothetical protein [Candidatus Aenigmarchaeota archaeon]MDW8160248.1 hypothetical protein [Candidatus Aenigmarchaeota archaeon]